MAIVRMLIFAAIVAVAFISNQTKADEIEDVAYFAIKQSLILDGYSENKAGCIANVLKWQGTTNDVTDLRGILTPAETVQKLKNKMDFSLFVCENGTLIGCLVALAFGILCCCCICCCCCRSKQQVLKVPNTIQLSVPLYSNVAETHPYERMDKV